MLTGITEIKTADGVCDSFVAYPSDQETYPAVLLLMDAYGPRQNLYDMAQEIAAQGYYVLLPNLFYRIRRAPVVDLNFPLRLRDMPEAISQIMALIKSFSHQEAVKDAQYFFDFLSQQKQVAGPAVMISGYCLGGSVGLRIAAAYKEKVAAIASFHASNLATEKPDSPHLSFNQISAEIYIANADKDQGMPPQQIAQLDQALKDAGVKYEMELYEGAPHGFTMKDLPAYNAEALQRHWKKLNALLARQTG